MPRQLIIVSRQHPDLFVYLSRRFAGQAEVEVILDRRLQDRRRKPVSVLQERRHRERRRQKIDALLRSRSHVIVTLE